MVQRIRKVIFYVILAFFIWGVFGAGFRAVHAQPECSELGVAATTPVPGAVRKPDGWDILLPWGPNETHQVINGYGTGDHQNVDHDEKANDHYALDFDLAAGEAVFPIAPGEIKYAGLSKMGWHAYGNFVLIDHGNGYQSLYAHLERIEAGIRPGVAVFPRKKIGEAGSGGENIPHLHFALYKDVSYKDIEEGVGPHGGRTVVPEPFQGETAYIGIEPGQCLTSNTRINLPSLRELIWDMVDSDPEVWASVKRFGSRLVY